jgi:hypothetical protein
MMWMSVPQIPHASTETATDSGPGSGSGTSRTSRSTEGSRVKSAAFTIAPDSVLELKHGQTRSGQYLQAKFHGSSTGSLQQGQVVGGGPAGAGGEAPGRVAPAGGGQGATRVGVRQGRCPRPASPCLN